jgi:hypothetical protein
MSDDTTGVRSRLSNWSTPLKEPETDEQECPAFGYLRGVRDRAISLEFRLRTGNRRAFPYSWLGPVIFDPSHGLLLRFVGDQTYLVLIRGWQLDGMVNGSTDLIERGILRHRVLWVREMSPAALTKVPKDQIAIQEILFASAASEEGLRGVEWASPFFVGTTE